MLLVSKRRSLWVVPAVLYVAFCFWYTNTEGSLTSEEIEVIVARITENGTPPERVALLRQFMESDDGGQFLMFNSLDMADDPPDVEGASPGEDADQLMGRYMAYMFPALFKRACHPALFGGALGNSMDLVGIDGAEVWSRAGVVRYRSRRDLFEIAGNPIFRGRHKFKLAALDKTIAYPIEPWLYLSDLRFLLALILLAGVALSDVLIYGRGR